MKLTSLRDTFLIINTPSIEEAEGFDRHVLDHEYIYEAEEFDRHVLHHQYSPVEEAVKLGRHVLITNTPSIKEAEEFDRHVLDHQYSLH